MGESQAVGSVRSAFERRRLFFAILLLLIPAALCGVMVRGFQNPTQPVLGPGLVDATPVGGRLATATLLAILPRGAEAATVASYSMCRAQRDIMIGGRRVPALSLLRVDGYSPSLGGVYLVGGTYQSVLDVRCDSPVPEIAVSLEVTVTPSPAVRASLGAVGVAATPAVVYRNVVVTATPGVQQLASATLPNGIVWDGDCVLLNLEGINRVYVDGQAATGHEKHCGMTKLEIFFR